MLEGFELYNMTTGVASISISENGVGFSKAAVMKMNKCEYTKVFIDRENKRFAIQAAEQNSDGSVQFFNKQNRRVVQHVIGASRPRNEGAYRKCANLCV